MLNSLFSSTEVNTGLTLSNILICTTVSIVLGIIIACIHMYKNQYSKSYIVTLALMPVIVQMVIILVNGNLGTGVAVMGAFSLVRFRSIPGNAREIGSIFLAMAVGLATGTGYVAAAAIFVVIIGFSNILLNIIPFGEQKKNIKDLKITIPENLDYEGVFDDIFSTYTNEAKLFKVKTTNMGSLFELQYKVNIKDDQSEKKFIDEIRSRNGNLTIVCSRFADNKEDL